MPQSLWFKQKYVEPILCGEKTHTIRPNCPRLKVGDRVLFQVGPRKAFCRVLIGRIEQIAVDDLDESQRVELRAIYPGIRDGWRIHFAVSDVPLSDGDDKTHAEQQEAIDDAERRGERRV